MKILVSGSIGMVRELAESYSEYLGYLITPTNPNRGSVVRDSLPYAADNGAYHGLEPERFRSLLALIREHPARCLWVVCPDVVGNARQTLDLFWRWRAEVATANCPLAFVGQDGAENLNIPWSAFKCWFIGGTTRWKLSLESVALAAEARRLGKWLHCGRVNSMRRLRWAYRIGCDSIDGSSYSKFHHRTITARPDMGLERHLRFLLALERQEASQQILF